MDGFLSATLRDLLVIFGIALAIFQTFLAVATYRKNKAVSLRGMSAYFHGLVRLPYTRFLSARNRTPLIALIALSGVLPLATLFLKALKSPAGSFSSLVFGGLMVGHMVVWSWWVGKTVDHALSSNGSNDHTIVALGIGSLLVVTSEAILMNHLGASVVLDILALELLGPSLPASMLLLGLGFAFISYAWEKLRERSSRRNQVF